MAVAVGLMPDNWATNVQKTLPWQGFLYPLQIALKAKKLSKNTTN